MTGHALFEEIHRLQSNAIEKALSFPNAVHIDVKGPCYAVGSDPLRDRLYDHPMFLDRAEAVDLAVVSESFIAGRLKTYYLGGIEFFQSFQAQMSIEQNVKLVFARFCSAFRMHSQKLDNSYLAGGGEDRLKIRGGPHLL